MELETLEVPESVFMPKADIIAAEDGKCRTVNRLHASNTSKVKGKDERALNILLRLRSGVLPFGKILALPAG